MSEPARLLLVTGPPCAGKTTLARRVGEALGWALFSKDTFKETLFGRLGSGDRAWSKTLSRAAFDLLFAVAHAELAAGRSLILEGNFHPAGHRAEVAPLLEAHGARLSQLVVTAEPSVILERFLARRRHAGHLDAEYLPELEALLASDSEWALALPGAVVRVDTSAGEPELASLLQGLVS